MRSASRRLQALLRRTLGSSMPEQHTQPPQRRSPGLDTLAATAYGPRVDLRL